MNDVVKIESSDIEHFAGQAEDVAGLLEDADGLVVDSSDEASAGSPGWKSVGAVAAAAGTLRDKTEALTRGTDGLFDFASSLRGFAVDVVTLDEVHAGELQLPSIALDGLVESVEGAFEGDYEPQAPA
ncbi:MAG: hypothetical protein ACRDXX_20630 [Stackebrandtia sp.]